VQIDITEVAKIIGAITVILGVIIGGYKWMDNQKQKDEELEKDVKQIKKEVKMLCKAVRACLDGLQQIGANHTVPIVKNELDNYLFDTAHDKEAS